MSQLLPTLTVANFMPGLARVSLVALTMLSAATTAGAARAHDDLTHAPLTVVGLAQGQTGRISVTNSPNPRSAEPMQPIVVEMMFHDSRGEVIVDRAGRPAVRTFTIEPHQSKSFELNGNNVPALGSRVIIQPCVRVVSIGGGSLAVPTFEMYNNFVRATTILSSGILKGFDPQPDPPVPPEVAFGAVGLTQGVTARLYVLNNAREPGRTPDPVTIEITFHDNDGNHFVDRAGREARKVVTIDPNHVEFLDLNGNDIAAVGSRVGIVPCIKVLGSSPGAHVALALETFVNFTQHTLTLANWSHPPEIVAPLPQ